MTEKDKIAYRIKALELAVQFDANNEGECSALNMINIAQEFEDYILGLDEKNE